jgi:ribonuclease HII
VDFKNINKIIVGVDEAGRGPLAGPVVAGAVILDPKRPISGLRDSKQLTEEKRETLFACIQDRALAWAFGKASVEEIDAINILQATMLAMQRAVAALSIIPELALIDGNRSPLLSCQTMAIIQGDAKIPAISAASIVAKVIRDREMKEWDIQFPQYGFAQHKGYGTRQHLAALSEHGPSYIHRQSFSPVSMSMASVKDLLLQD